MQTHEDATVPTRQHFRTMYLSRNDVSKIFYMKSDSEKKAVRVDVSLEKANLHKDGNDVTSMIELMGLHAEIPTKQFIILHTDWYDMKYLQIWALEIQGILVAFTVF